MEVEIMQALYYAAMMFLAVAPLATAAETVRWERSMDEALARAQKEDKPVLVLYAFGKQDEEFT